MTKLLMKYLSIIVTIYCLSLVFYTIQIDSIPALLFMGLCKQSSKTSNFPPQTIQHMS